MSASGITSESFSISDADGDSYFFWAGDGARELLPWTAGPGAQKNFDPEHPLARDSKGRGLALAAPSIFLFNTVCVVSSSLALCISHPLPIPRGPSVRALACMFVNVEVVKGAKFLHEVHWTCPLPGACELSVLTRSPLPFLLPLSESL